jgi:2-methylisocitrate lyase-like PEP mutase family enzyme
MTLRRLARSRTDWSVQKRTTGAERCHPRAAFRRSHWSENRATPQAAVVSTGSVTTLNAPAPASTADRARRLHALHDRAAPLALANVWDVASARVVEAAGAPALATTSAGVAWALGVPDGDRLARADLLAVVRRITDAVTVPVSVDAEGGFATDPADVAATVRGLIDAGAVGVNLEDGACGPDGLATRVAVARAAADRAGVPLFVNARTDVFLGGGDADDGRFAEAVARARRYVEAGADGIFVPGVVDRQVIAALAEAVPVPLNVMVRPGLPPVAELGRLGVARVSLGSSVAEAAYAVARRAALELVAAGTYASVADGLDYAELDALVAGSRP